MKTFILLLGLICGGSPEVDFDSKEQVFNFTSTSMAPFTLRASRVVGDECLIVYDFEIANSFDELVLISYSPKADRFVRVYLSAIYP